MKKETYFIFITLSLLLFLFLISGCGDDEITNITPTATPGNNVTQNVTTNGGRVSVSQAAVDFPANSLENEVAVTGRVVTDVNLPSVINLTGNIYSFVLSDGNSYNRDTATITLSAEGSTAEDLTIYHSKDGTNWKSIGGTVEEDKISGTIPSFSYFAAGNPKPVSGVWTSPVKINDENSGAIGPAMDIDSYGNVYAVWTDERKAIENNIYYSYLYIDTTWSPNEKLTDTGGFYSFPEIAVDPSGHAYFTFTEFHFQEDPNSPPPSNDIKLISRSSDSIKTTSTVTAGVNYKDPDAAIDLSGELGLIVVANEDIKTFELSGDAWSENTLSSGGNYKSPRIASNNSGDFCAAWTNQDGSGDPNSTTVEVSHRTSGGTWTLPGAVDTLPVNGSLSLLLSVEEESTISLSGEPWENDPGVYQLDTSKPDSRDGTAITLIAAGESYKDPVIARDNSNNLYAAWRDESGNGAILFSSSSPGGGWTSPVRVDDGAAEQPGKYGLDIKVDPFGRVYVIWDGEKDGVSGVYVSVRE